MTPLHERGASAQDIYSRIGVGVGDVPTRDAQKDRLALTVFGVNDSTLSARLRRVWGGNVGQPPASGLQFVFQHVGKHRPALRQDRSVQSALLGYVSSRRLDRAGSAGCHAPDVEAFDCDKAEPAHDVRARDVQVVASHASEFASDARDQSSLFRVSPRSALAPGQNSLSLPPLAIQRRRIRQSDMLARRKAEGRRDAAQAKIARLEERCLSLAENWKLAAQAHDAMEARALSAEAALQTIANRRSITFGRGDMSGSEAFRIASEALAAQTERRA